MGSVRGILLVLLSMAMFSVEDALIKTLSQTLPVGQIMAMLGLGGALVFAAFSRGRIRAMLSALAHPVVLWRSLGEAAAAITFIAALSMVPLSTVAAVFQATPLAVTAGAALAFGERVGWRRWLAVIVGFAGVLMIIRPGLEGFRPESLLVVITVFAIAMRDLVTRRIPDHIPSTAVSFHGFAAVFVAGIVLMATGDAPVSPAPGGWLLILGAIACGTTGYQAIVAAMRGTDASALMPFRYARLVFSLLIGVTIFGEQPDAMTLSGAAVIIAAAFYTYQRERRLAVRARQGLGAA